MQKYKGRELKDNNISYLWTDTIKGDKDDQKDLVDVYTPIYLYTDPAMYIQQGPDHVYIHLIYILNGICIQNSFTCK